ncbi:MAG: hypothetical protein RBU30_12260 [Polyangia bacterium]|jgi:hypothetical protein|nr:hypothetical protein [Polyangia bacterium]
MEYPLPQAICLEDLDALSDAERFLCCVALPGRQPGLGLDARGEVRWETGRPLACELWVTADSKLALFRTRGSGEVLVSRAGRRLAAPCEQPVILLDQDLLEVGGRRLRLHLHGECEAGAAPRFFGAEDGGLGGLVRAAAAALAIGTASLVGAAGCQGNAGAKEPGKDRIEVRTKPPDIGPPVRPRPKPDAGAMQPDMRDAPIEVRLQPPQVPARPSPRDAGVPKPPKPPEPAMPPKPPDPPKPPMR